VAAEDSAVVSRALSRGSGLLALRLSQYVFLFVSGIVVTRALGPELRAQYALAWALGSGTWVLVNLSLHDAAGRLLARREASLRDLSRGLLSTSVLLGAVGAGAVVAIGLVFRDALLSSASTGAVALAALVVPLMLVQQMMVGLLVRIGALRAYGWGSALSSAGQLVLVLAIVAASALSPEDALAVAVAGLAARAVGFALVLRRHAGAGSLLPRPPRGLAGRMLRLGLVLHPAYIALALNLRIDLFMVSAYTGARATGLYSLAASLAEIMFLGATSIYQAAMRTQTEADEDAAARYTLEFVRQSVTIAVIGAALVASLAYPMIVVVYGGEWRGSAVPLAILAFAAVAFSLQGPVYNMLVRIARPVEIAAAAGTAAAVNIGLNLMLIPLLGIVGAALASLVSYWLYALLLLWRFKRLTGLPVRAAFGRPREGDLVFRVLGRVRRRVWAGGATALLVAALLGGCDGSDERSAETSTTSQSTEVRRAPREQREKSKTDRDGDTKPETTAPAKRPPRSIRQLNVRINRRLTRCLRRAGLRRTRSPSSPLPGTKVVANAQTRRGLAVQVFEARSAKAAIRLRRRYPRAVRPTLVGHRLVSYMGRAPARVRVVAERCATR
jgi:O-antigen/teichoic acid export membrane protein